MPTCLRGLAFGCCFTASAATCFVLFDDDTIPLIAAAATTATTHAGTSTTTARRHVSCRNTRRGSGSPSARTRSRTVAGASVGKARSSRTSSSNSCSKSTVSDAGIAHHLLESFQGAAQPRRTCRLTDPEQARGRRAVEIEQHAQRDDLALRRRKVAERRRERAFAERRVLRRTIARESLLAAQPAFLGTEVIERDTPRDLAEPRTRGAATRIEAPPGAERLLERLRRELLGDGAVAGEEQQVAMHRVQLRFGDGGKRRSRRSKCRQGRRDRVHVLHTPPRAPIVPSGLCSPGARSGLASGADQMLNGRAGSCLEAVRRRACARERDSEGGRKG